MDLHVLILMILMLLTVVVSALTGHPKTTRRTDRVKQKTDDWQR
jgi:hypothetical protein